MLICQFNVEKAKNYFEKLGFSNCSKTYDFLKWYLPYQLTQEQYEFPPNLFHQIKFKKLLISSQTGFLKNISFKTFETFTKHKNNYTTDLTFKLSLNLNLKTFFDLLCSQFTDLSYIFFTFNYVLEDNIYLTKEYF